MSGRVAPPARRIPRYLSGWCGTNGHDRCRGAYAGVDCVCSCHTPPPPPPVPTTTRCADGDHRHCPGPLCGVACACDCHTLPDPCPNRLRGRWGDYDQWPCVRATGHDGDCYTHPDADDYPTPLDTWGHAALVSEFRMRLAQIANERRDLHAGALRNQNALHHAVNRLIALAPANGGRKNVPAAEIRQVWQDALAGKTEAPSGGLAGHRQTPRTGPPGDAAQQPNRAVSSTPAPPPNPPGEAERGPADSTHADATESLLSHSTGGGATSSSRRSPTPSTSARR